MKTAKELFSEFETPGWCDCTSADSKASMAEYDEMADNDRQRIRKIKADVLRWASKRISSEDMAGCNIFDAADVLDTKAIELEAGDE